MKLTGDILRDLRKKRNMNQADVAKGILSRQAYSKIEHNNSDPSIEVFIHILNRLNYSFPDFLTEKDNFTKENYYHNLFLKAVEQDITHTEIKELYTYVSQHKNDSASSLYFYGRVVGHLQKRYSQVISKFTKADKTLFKKYILSLGNDYSLYDIRFIGDFASIAMTHEELATLYDKFPEFSPLNYAYDISNYHTQICKLYANFSDVFLSHKDLHRAEDSNTKLQKFLNQKMNLRYSFHHKINQITLNYLKTNSKEILEELKKIAETLEYLGDNQTANAARYQYKAYINNKQYNPEDAYTPDK